ncbi:MAG: RsbRD N-terminal domain-containing protein [Planctomycetota bacterium]
MMSLGDLLLAHQDAILRRWCDDVLATYPESSAAAFRRETDPFANPVGHALRVGTRAIFEALCAGRADATLRGAVEAIVRIRAVQELSAAQAVAFVFHLKDALRAELREALAEPRLTSELAALERRIDGAALVAFDVFVECREQIAALRINELKRNVPWIVGKLSSRQPEARSPLGKGPGEGHASAEALPLPQLLPERERSVGCRDLPQRANGQGVRP